MTEVPIIQLKKLDCEEIVSILESLSIRDRRKMLARIIEDSRYRPDDLVAQYQLFEWMIRSDLCEAHIRINAKIAGAHKAMELMDCVRCEMMLPLVDKQSSDLSGLKPSVSSRRDRTHLELSLLATHFQMLLFLNKIDCFESLASQSKELIIRVDRSRLTRAFFISSVNVVRCLAFIGLVEFKYHNEAALRESLAAIRKVFMVAFSKGAFRHLVKHEWMLRVRRAAKQLVSRSSSLPWELCASDVYMQFDEVLRATTMMTNVQVACEYLGSTTSKDRPMYLGNAGECLEFVEFERIQTSLLVSAIRPENADKVRLMVRNFLG
jgi:hypothetical protein